MNDPQNFQNASSNGEQQNWQHPPAGWIPPPGWLEYQQYLAHAHYMNQFAQPQTASGDPRRASQIPPPDRRSSQIPQPMYYGYPSIPPAAAGDRRSSTQTIDYNQFVLMQQQFMQQQQILQQQQQQAAVDRRRSSQLPQDVANSGYYPYGSAHQQIDPQQQYYNPYPGYPYGMPPAAGYSMPFQYPPNYPYQQQQEIPSPTNIPTKASNSTPQSSRPPPPKAQHQAKPNRVKVAFDDEDSDEEFERHDTLQHFDIDDVHEMTDTDLAELDDGKHNGVENAGIIEENGIPVVPAITLKDTTSTMSTVPVQSVDAPLPTRRLSEAAKRLSFRRDFPNVNEEENEEGAKTGEEASMQIDANEEKNSSPIEDQKPTPPISRTNSRGSFRPAAGILGAAAAVFGGSLKKLLGSSRSGSTNQLASNQEANNESIDVAAAAAAASAIVSAEVQKKEDEEKTSFEKEDPEETQAKEETPVEENKEEIKESAMKGVAETEVERKSHEETSEVAAAAETPQNSSTPPVAVTDQVTNSKTVNIKIRTLAGKSSNLDNLNKSMSLSELREIIFENMPSIPYDEQRLLFKGRMIEILDPSTTIEELGFKDGDMIHLVRTARGTSNNNPAGGSTVSMPSSPAPIPQQRTPPPNSASEGEGGLQMLTVLVPAGRGPGDRLRILPAGRGAMLVTVPAGVFAGDRFRVLLPPEDPSEYQRAEQLMLAEQQRAQELARQQMLLQQQQQHQQQQQQQMNRPQIMAVVVPKGFRAGQVMDVNVPGRGRVRVTIPNGVRAGQQFKFRLPN